MRKVLAVILCTVALSAVTIGIAVADKAFQDAFVPSGGSGGMVSDNGQIELAGASYTVNVVVGPEWAYTTPVSVGMTLTGQPDSTGTANFGLRYR